MMSVSSGGALVVNLLSGTPPIPRCDEDPLLEKPAQYYPDQNAGSGRDVPNGLAVLFGRNGIESSDSGTIATLFINGALRGPLSDQINAFDETKIEKSDDLTNLPKADEFHVNKKPPSKDIKQDAVSMAAAAENASGQSGTENTNNTTTVATAKKELRASPSGQGDGLVIGGAEVRDLAIPQAEPGDQSAEPGKSQAEKRLDLKRPLAGFFAAWSACNAVQAGGTLQTLASEAIGKASSGSLPVDLLPVTGEVATACAIFEAFDASRSLFYHAKDSGELEEHNRKLGKSGLGFKEKLDFYGITRSLVTSEVEVNANLLSRDSEITDLADSFLEFKRSNDKCEAHSRSTRGKLIAFFRDAVNQLGGVGVKTAINVKALVVGEVIRVSTSVAGFFGFAFSITSGLLHVIAGVNDSISLALEKKANMDATDKMSELKNKKELSAYHAIQTALATHFIKNQENRLKQIEIQQVRAALRITYGGVATGLGVAGLVLTAVGAATGGIGLIAILSISAFGALLGSTWLAYAIFKIVRASKDVPDMKDQDETLTSIDGLSTDAVEKKYLDNKTNEVLGVRLLARYLVGDLVQRQIAVDILNRAGVSHFGEITALRVMLLSPDKTLHQKAYSYISYFLIGNGGGLRALASGSSDSDVTDVLHQ